MPRSRVLLVRLLGLAASTLEPTSTTSCCTTRLLELLRRQRDRQLHAGLPEPRTAAFLGVPVALAGVFFFALVLGLAARLSGRDARRRARALPGLHLRALDHRARVRALPGLRVVLRAAHGLHAVR